MDLADQLQKLQTLREQGALTEDEFVLAKKRVLDGTASQASNGGAPSNASFSSSSALNQFRRSTSDKWIGGVCGGLAALSNIPAWSWRILFLLTVLLHGIGAIVYILLWIFVPIQLNVPQPVAEEMK